MQSISPRQQSILNRVVDTYIETAQPVGSQWITQVYTEIYRDSYSSATVRHEMGLLEEMGYLTHPHPSAGRVPTDLGYRYYVNHGLHCQDLSEAVSESLFQDLETTSKEVDALAERASSVLSNLVEEVGFVLISERLVQEDRKKRSRLFAQGVSRILEKPEFRDVEKARLLLRTIEEKINLVECLQQQTIQEGVWVSIGRENEKEVLWDCSVVSSRYTVKGANVGSVAVIGPRRMKYAKAIPVVKRMAKMLGNLLEEINDVLS